MDFDDPTHRSGVAGRHGNSDAVGSRVVLAADRDPDVTDEIAVLLRDSYTVRTAYDSADALASLDADVSVVLLDPALPGLSARRVVDRVTTDAVDCQVAALADEEPDALSTAFDDYLLKPIVTETLRDTVDRLCRRAAYRTALGEYYALAERYATLSEDDPDRDRVRRRLDELSDELDDVFDSLEGSAAYDAALRELRTSY